MGQFLFSLFLDGIGIGKDVLASVEERKLGYPEKTPRSKDENL